MAISLKSIGGAIKSGVSKAVNTVKSAFSSAGSSSQGANALKATTTSAALKNASNASKANAARDVATYNTQISKASQLNTVKNGVLGIASYLSSQPNKVKTAMDKFVSGGSSNKLTSQNTPSSINATDLGSGTQYFDTPSINPASSDMSSYLGTSAINSGSNMGMSGSTVTTPTGATTTPLTPLEEERKKREDELAKNQQDLIDMMNELAGKPKEQARLETQQGIPQATAELRDLQAKQTLQTAQYMQQVQDIQNKPIAMEFIAGQQGEVNRRAGIDAMITSALIQGKQGQIQTAQDTVDRALSLKYDPIVTRIDTQKAILDMNYKNLSRADQAVADARSEMLDLQKNQLNYDRDIRKSLIGDIYSSMKDGSIDYSTGNAQISQIMDENTKLSDIFKSMGITDANNPGIVNGYDITSYATDPNHETKINAIVQGVNITNAQDAQQTINRYAPKSPITGAMLISSANKYGVDPNVMFALMLNDSSLGTAGKATKTFNPGNVGNIDSGATRNYGSWANGVDAVADWLSKHKAKKLYNGEFADTINNVVTFEPQKSQKTVQKNLQSQIANGNYPSAYNQMQNSVSKGLTGENKTRYDAARIDVNVLSKLQNSLQQYELASGNTGFLKGTSEQIARKFGQLKTDPKYAQLAVQMEREFQAYRNQMTGAAFTPAESREYDAVNPSGKKSFALNLSVITGAVNQLKNRVYSTEEALAGDGVKYIREYAMGIDPLIQKMSEAKTGGGPTVTNKDYFNNLY